MSISANNCVHLCEEAMGIKLAQVGEPIMVWAVVFLAREHLCHHLDRILWD